MRIIFFAFYLLSSEVALAQTGKEVNVGDPAPDLIFNNIANHKNATAKISDFRNKLLILDFWSTGCADCIASFPKMEKLQKTFNDSIQIILINTHENDSLIEKRTARYKNFKYPELPVINGDSTIRKYFPYNTVPHHIWIDGKGSVLAITNGYNATPENIRKVLNNEVVKLAVKKYILNADRDADLIIPTNPAFNDVMDYYSAFFRYSPAMGGSAGRRKSEGTDIWNKYYFKNHPIYSLFTAAFGRDKWISSGNLNPFDYKNRVVLKVKDTSDYYYPSDFNVYDEWLEKNAFTYEIKVPVEAAPQLFTLMQNDLNRYFSMKRGVTARVEKRKIKCWILSLSKNHSLHTDGGEQVSTSSDSLYSHTNKPMARLINALNHRLHESSFPVIDETGFMGNMDITLHCHLTDISCLKKELGRYGIQLKAGERLMDILVISENDYK